MLTKCLLITLFLLYAGVARAELLRCDGVWVNRSCDGSVSSALRERPAREPNRERRERSQRESWVVDLEHQAFLASRRYEVKVSTVAARKLCLNGLSSAEECVESIERISREIQKLVTAKQELEERKRKEAESQGDRNVTAVVINQGWRCSRRSRRWGNRERRRPHTPRSVEPRHHLWPNLPADASTRARLRLPPPSMSQFDGAPPRIAPTNVRAEAERAGFFRGAR